MKIYVAVNNPYLNSMNPYISTLIDNLNSQYSDIVWGYGIDKFWSNDIYLYDIIYIHWPDLLLSESRFTFHKSKDLEKRIEIIKKREIKIVSTCHNITPHYCNNQDRINAYKIIYKYSNLILHLGEYSKKIFKTDYPTVKHVLLPHHIYDEVYKTTPTKKEAIQMLNLSEGKQYILCFGAFRDNEERNFIKYIYKKLHKENIEFLVPSFVKIPQRRNKLLVIKELLKFYYTKFRYKGLHLSRKYIDNDLLPYYYAAADIALIHRIHILNSGNIPLAFLMKKVVVGPNVGNVGGILTKTKNPIFHVDNLESIIPAIHEGLYLSKTQKGIDNYNMAMKELKTNIIADKLYKYFTDLINN